MKKGILVPHPSAMQMYIDFYGLDITHNFSRKFYEDILHLLPTKIYDTNGEDFEHQLENTVLKHALDKTSDGLIKCRACITETLSCLTDELVEMNAVLQFLNVTHTTREKLYIEIEDIGEHNGDGKIV